MQSIPFAFSVHHFVNSVGADAGFASIVGLAVLILLYFSQARETSTLRAHARDAAERIQQLEAHIAQLMRARQAAAPPPQAVQGAAGQGAVRRVVPPPAVAAAAGSPSRVAAVSAAFAAIPAPPAGVAAPALSAATKLIPTRVPVPEPAAGAVATAPPDALPEVQQPAAPAPATVAGGANGVARQPVMAPPTELPPRPEFPQRSDGERQQFPQRPVRPVGAEPPPRVQVRPRGSQAQGRRPAPSRGRSDYKGSPPRARRVLVALFAVIALGAVVAVLVKLTSGSSGSHTSSTTAAQTSNAPSKHKSVRTPAFSPGKVTVTVLNGTSTSHLAGTIAGKLTADGYKPGTTGNAPDQTHTATIVAYMPGHKQAALAVAASLKLAAGAVQPIDPSTQQVACPSTASCTADVVVTVGSDLATTS